MSDSKTVLPGRVALSDDRLDYIARSYFANKRDQESVKDAIFDAFKEAQSDVPEADCGNMQASTQPVIANVTATKMLPGFIQLTYSNGAIVKKLPLVDENGDEYMELQPNNPDTFHATTPKDYFLFPQPVIAGAARDDVAKAVRFAGMVLAAHRNDGYPGDVDGSDLQRMAVECGMIEEREVEDRCGETCSCAEVGGSMAFPTQCFFDTDAGKAAIAASKESQ